MQLPPFDRAKAKYDAYNAWHIVHSAHPTRDYYDQSFVQFESGEFLIVSSRFKPEYRGYNTKFDLHIFAAHDDANIPRLKTLDGVSVKQAWLSSGTCFVADPTTKRVIQMQPWCEDPNIPMALRKRGAVYFASPGANPIGAATTTLALPFDRRKNQTLIKHIEELKTVCRAWMNFAGESRTTYNNTVAFKPFNRDPRDVVGPEELYVSPSRRIAAERFANRAFEDLTPYSRLCLALCPVYYPRECVAYPYLLLD